MPDQISGLLSPFLRHRRLRAARPYLGGGRVLDIGCGTGALAAFVSPGDYLGVDLDEDSIQIARREHPLHAFKTLSQFEQEPPPAPFDTIVGLAVIEHVPVPAEWLRQMAGHLCSGGRMVLTTPHPNYRRVHEWGAAIGLFSREGAAEHHIMLDDALMEQTAAAVGLAVERRERFLFGANQLFVLRHAPPA